MPRNQMEVTRTRTRVETPFIGSSQYPDQVTTTSAIEVKSTRSDIVPTTPISGHYVTPTTYGAYFFSAHTQSGEAWYQEPNGSVRYRQKWDGYVHGLSFANGVDVASGVNGHYNSPIIAGQVLSRARSNALDKVRANDLNLGVTIGEARESANFVLKTAVTALRLIRRPWMIYHSLNPRDAASAFLAYKFGLRPLMADIHAGLSVLQSGLAAPIGHVKAVAMDDTFFPPAPTASRRHDIHEWRRGVEVSYTFRLDNPGLFELWRYGLTNPLSIAWELVTLSFVVDWFTGLGSFLSSLQGPLGLTYLSGYETSFHSVRHTRWDNPAHLNGRTGCIGIPGRRFDWIGTDLVCKASKRTVLTGFPVSKPYLSLGLDSSKLASMVALIAARS